MALAGPAARPPGDRDPALPQRNDGLDIGAVVAYWDARPDLAKFGVGYLLHGQLDNIVDGYFAPGGAANSMARAARSVIRLGPPGRRGTGGAAGVAWHPCSSTRGAW